MSFYDALHIPQPCLVDKTVAKKLFAEVGNPFSRKQWRRSPGNTA